LRSSRGSDSTFSTGSRSFRKRGSGRAAAACFLADSRRRRPLAFRPSRRLSGRARFSLIACGRSSATHSLSPPVISSAWPAVASWLGATVREQDGEYFFCPAFESIPNLLCISLALS
jgi:hypothetical protein